MKGTEKREFSSADTRFLYLYDSETLRFASSNQFFPTFASSFLSLSLDSTTSDVRIFDETVPENERSPVRRERAEEVTMWRKRERENSHAAKRREGTSSYAERPRERG